MLGALPVVYAGRGSWRVALASGGGVLLGLLLSAFHWIPAFFYRDRMRVEDLLRDKFQVRHHFKDFLELFDPTVVPHSGPLTLMLVLVAPIVLVWMWRERRLASLPGRLLVGATLAVFVLLVLNLRGTLWIWEQAPLLALFQFPWRLLGPVALLVAVMGAVYAVVLAQAGSTGRRRYAGPVFEGCVLIGCVLNALLVFSAIVPLSDDEWRRYESDFRGGATVYNEYVPRGATAGIWMLQPALSGPLVRHPESLRANWLRNDGTRIEGELVADRPTMLAFGRWALPEWRATLNERPARWLRSPLGTVLLPVPPGSHRVALVLDPPPLRRIFLEVSLITAAGLLLAWAWLWLRRRR